MPYQAIHIYYTTFRPQDARGNAKKSAPEGYFFLKKGDSMNRYLFFDLDGTVCNTAEGILNSVTYAMDKLGLPRQPREQMLHYIGPPLIRTFAEDYHLSDADAQRAVDAYREFYSVQGIFECRLYDGILELLDRMADSGYGLVLATCKPAVSARRVLEHFGILERFRFVSGPELDGTRNEKHEVIAYAREMLGLSAADRILMVGDRRDDVRGAHREGLPCAGVLWGFGTREELTAAGADALFSTPADAAEQIPELLGGAK